MKTKPTYLKGKSVFIVSILVIIVTILTVYWSGIHYNRSLTANLYRSLGVIATALFLFMTYGLYTGIRLINDFPKFKSFKTGDYLPSSGTTPDISDMPDIDVGEGIGALILSVLFWIGMTILFVILLIFLEAIFWFSIFIILAMLYWIFFRALKLVFSKSRDTKGDIWFSSVYALSYTALYIGWIFGIVYLVQVIK
ncbi:hypothetical protein [Aquimarina sediminis]|uniref:hypothetical protein n=1 Tax=Aquimarina sediminis TaxID=2070536 RepID=UPI000CA026C1|nr:hypothetical protein [Aquimarina sediminis]